MAQFISPYLLTPCRDLPTACKQIRQARGKRTRPCAACAVSHVCQEATRTEPQAVSQLPEPLRSAKDRAIVRAPGRTKAA